MSARLLRSSSPTNSSSSSTLGESRSTYEIRLISDLTEFDALRGAWSALAHASRAGIFLQHEWFDAAWQWRHRTARLYLLCMVRGSDLLAVLPLVCEQTVGRATRLRELSFLTVPDTQVCDMLVLDGEQAAASAAFADALAMKQREWDVLRLRYLAPDSVAASSLRDALARRGFTARLEQRDNNPYVRLDSRWEDYYATRSRSLKKANNLAANRLKKAGEVRIDWLEPGARDAARLAEVIDAIIAISAASWKRRTGNSLDNPGPQAFIRRLSQLASERGWLSVWTLSLDGRPLAMEYQLVADGHVFALRSDFDEAFDEISPGSHLGRCLLERLFGRGLERYSMGPGENAYKQRWAEGGEPVAELVVYGRTVRGRLLGAWETTLKPMAKLLRDKLIRGRRRPAPGSDDR